MQENGTIRVVDSTKNDVRWYLLGVLSFAGRSGWKVEPETTILLGAYASTMYQSTSLEESPQIACLYNLNTKKTKRYPKKTIV